MNKKLVTIVLDKKFKNNLLNQLKKSHVWLINSDENINEIKKNKKEINELYSKTDINDPFDLGMSLIPNNFPKDDEHFIELIEEIDEHINQWSKIEVFGIKPTNKIIKKIKKFGAKLKINSKNNFTIEK